MANSFYFHFFFHKHPETSVTDLILIQHKLAKTATTFKKLFKLKCFHCLLCTLTHLFATMLCNVLDAFCNTYVDGKAAHDALVEALMQVI